MPHDVVNPAVQGNWTGAVRTPGDTSTLNDGQGAYPVHLILMHTGRVLIFSGGWENTDLLHRSWSFDPATWNPATPTVGVIGRWFLPEFDDDPVANPPPPTGTHDPDIDLFCTHHVQIEDGRILCTGGDGIFSHNNDSIHFYDPVAERWSRIPEEMVAGRWYPTAVALPDGSVAVFSGDSTGNILVKDTELMSPPDYEPRVITGGRRQIAGVDNAQRSYPGMFLVPGGRMFYVPTAFDYTGGTQAQVEAQLGNTMSFQVTSPFANPPVGVWQDHGVRPADMMRQEGTALLLSPAQAGRIALIGGGRAQIVTPRNTIEILETQGAAPAWVPGGQMHHTRANVNAVLLPDGKVLIVGGTGGFKWDGGGSPDLRRFGAELWDPSIPYDATNPTAAFTQTGEMHRSRQYHSGAILLPDGRVLVAGGEDNLGLRASGVGPQPGEKIGSSQRTMEFYEPPYMHNGARPVITSIGETGGPDDQIHYGGLFTVLTPATDVATVALMRPGAPTHHTDTEQRRVPLEFWAVPGGYRVRAPTDAATAPPGYYMVWIVDSQGRPCQRASFVRLNARFCRLITDRSQFSLHEVQSAAVAGVSSFDHALFVVVEGYRPNQVGILSTTPTQLQLDAWAPALAFRDAATNAPVAGMTYYVMAMYLEVNDLAVRQRITFEYGVRFTGTAMFPPAGVGSERLAVRVESTINGHLCVGAIDLFLQPNPYMVDGQTHWLSDDLRVFQIRPGGAQSGIAFPAAATPEGYLQTFLAACDGAPDAAGHPFRQISVNQHDSRLELSTQVGGEAVYNYAVARVHYKSVGTPATDVRLFFRAFTTAATSMEYRPETYPWNPATNLPGVGANTTDVLSIPFFSVPRGTVGASGDTQNVKALPASGAGGETLRYFGAWLDINATAAVITDPGDGIMKSVQDLIRGQHQCLIAEIRFGPDPIPTGATPASNENLSQRNLAIVESDNPGPADAHTVTHTFQLRTTWGIEKKREPEREREREREFVGTHVDRFRHGAGDEAFGERHRLGEDALDHHVPFRPGTGEDEFGERVPIGPGAGEREREEEMPFRAVPRDGAFDELMILWGGIPEDSVATLYMPALRADDILAAAALRYEVPRLEKVDDHTIRCRVGDVSWVPLPAGEQRQVAGLFTIVLPQKVRTGEQYRVQVRQHSRAQGRIVGTFEVLIAVRNAEDILPGEARLLAVLRSIARGIPRASGWFNVFQRYVDVVADRVRGLGGDPTKIGPSSSGDVPKGALPERPGGELPVQQGVARDDECCREVQRGLRTLTIVLAAGLFLLVLILLLLLWRL
jgi:hypothetical protein